MDKILDLYSDYLLCSNGATTATGLSSLLNGRLSHDKITHYLSGNSFDSKSLWLEVKPLVRLHESPEGCLIFDDTIIEKSYMDENEIVCWHWDHCKGSNVKGLNLLSAFYVSSSPTDSLPLRVPVCFEIIRKTVLFCEIKTHTEKRKSSVTKNELMQQMVKQSIANSLLFLYVLADSWFASAENMRFIHKEKKFFIFEMKENRLCALTDELRNQGHFTKIDRLEIPENTPTKVWLKDLEIPVLLIKQVFTNKDGSVGVRFLVSNKLDLSNDEYATTYKKRWGVEEYHKSLKQNASVGKSPARTEKTQSNHLYMAICGYIKLERMKFVQTLNHFAMKAKIYQAALTAAFKEIGRMKQECALA